MQLKAIADDIEVLMIWQGETVLVVCKDTAYDIPMNTTKGQTRTFRLTPEQAAATMALFIIGDMPNEELNKQLYAIAEPAWKGVPQAFRPIP